MPLIVNPSLVSNVGVSCSETVKHEHSTVQSRGTSPMVPASEIEETAQEMIDNSPVLDKGEIDIPLIRKGCITDDDESSFSSTDSFVNDRLRYSDIDTKEEPETVVKIKIDSSTDTKDNTPLRICENALKPEIKLESENQNDMSSIPEINKDDEKQQSDQAIATSDKLDSQNVEESKTPDQLCDQTNEKTSSDIIETKQNDEYNPFLDPQILQAVDGLELLSALAEKRSKSIDAKVDKTEDEQMEEKEEKDEILKEEQKEEPVIDVKEEKPKTVKKPKLKRTISRTRSIPPIKEPETQSYYTSTGLRIPQGIFVSLNCKYVFFDGFTFTVYCIEFESKVFFSISF